MINSPACLLAAMSCGPCLNAVVVVVIALLSAPLALGVVSRKPATISPARATEETPEAANKGKSQSPDSSSLVRTCSWRCRGQGMTSDSIYRV